ncbi:hypothetical protein, conserved [Leishmania tarentolae]|uniref:J domain-containing protein n=1 Tax=Leishmania tarentolae TaxID=5689 RepID=A0A640KEB8_LEITA|nr:hypothetical protein, conserved [Leishmania tarentolae]
MPLSSLHSLMCPTPSTATTMTARTRYCLTRASHAAAGALSLCRISSPCHPLLLPMPMRRYAAPISSVVASPRRLREHTTSARVPRSLPSLSLTSSLSLASSSSARRCASMRATMASGGSSAMAAWHIARCHASTGRRPTFTEIAEALQVLEVSIDVDPKALKKRYRELVRRNHPDAGGEEATMARVTVAYQRLSELTKREREEFKLQKKMFHGGGGASSAASRRYRPGPSGGFGYAAPNEPFQAQAANMYGSYYQQDANHAYHQAHGKGQNGYWSHFHSRNGSGGFAENPFTSKNPFSMYAQAHRARFMPSSSLLIQGLVVYLVLSTMFLFAYRSYRDWRHDDGWRMSESLARHEQMEELHRIRQEMNERARALQHLDDESAAAAFYRRQQYVGESPTARAYEYARQRRIQLLQEQQEAAVGLPELRGWPTIGEDKGRIIKRAQDPPGVAFFEPHKEDIRRRQIENHRRGNNVVVSSSNEPPPSQLNEPAQGRLSGATTATAVPASSRAAGSSAPPPPETNISSVVVRPVGSEQEAQAVMRGIFGDLRKIVS